eukprot:728985-Rhodomonas_salina.2
MACSTPLASSTCWSDPGFRIVPFDEVSTICAVCPRSTGAVNVHRPDRHLFLVQNVLVLWLAPGPTGQSPPSFHHAGTAGAICSERRAAPNIPCSFRLKGEQASAGERQPSCEETTHNIPLNSLDRSVVAMLHGASGSVALVSILCVRRAGGEDAGRFRPGTIVGVAIGIRLGQVLLSMRICTTGRSSRNFSNNTNASQSGLHHAPSIIFPPSG